MTIIIILCKNGYDVIFWLWYSMWKMAPCPRLGKPLVETSCGWARHNDQNTKGLILSSCRLVLLHLNTMGLCQFIPAEDGALNFLGFTHFIQTLIFICICLKSFYSTFEKLPENPPSINYKVAVRNNYCPWKLRREEWVKTIPIIEFCLNEIVS